jgi:hypothetical protein
VASTAGSLLLQSASDSAIAPSAAVSALSQSSQRVLLAELASYPAAVAVVVVAVPGKKRSQVKSSQFNSILFHYPLKAKKT